MKNELDIFYHYLQKGNISLTTYKLIVEAMERIEANERENKVIWDAIQDEIEQMDKQAFNQFHLPSMI
jgi:hypothetical protein